MVAGGFDSRRPVTVARYCRINRRCRYPSKLIREPGRSARQTGSCGCRPSPGGCRTVDRGPPGFEQLEFLVVPIYEYKCRVCNEHFEVEQSFTDEALTEIDGCSVDESGRHQVKKVFVAPAISFKGDGFYRNDARSSAASSTSDTPSEKSSDTSTDSASKSEPSTGTSSEKSSSGDKATTSSSSSSGD